jgi:hypothetical protein
VTIEQIVCVSIGAILHAATFAVGVLAGISMSRKEVNHGRDSNPKAYNHWHDVERR